MLPTSAECSARFVSESAEAHGQAEMMEFNYLSAQGAIHRESTSGRYAIDYAKMPAAVADLAKELLEIEATGDRQRAENWFQKYGTMPDALQSRIEVGKRQHSSDVDPVFSFQIEGSLSSKRERAHWLVSCQWASCKFGWYRLRGKLYFSLRAE